jgi:hypothetical protein
VGVFFVHENDDGKLEDAGDGSIDTEDLILVEQTAQCRSTHQGEHDMSRSEAVLTPKGLELRVWGGEPAYAGSLRVRIGPDRKFHCAFEAVSMTPQPPRGWTITKKILKMRSAEFEAGRRILAWLSVEFDETSSDGTSTRSYKVEGYLKPYIQNQRPQQPSPVKKSE